MREIGAAVRRHANVVLLAVEHIDVVSLHVGRVLLVRGSRRGERLGV